jgi:hypothetical protein
LFHADVTKPFDILNPATGERQLFNIVTAFEFFEHPLPEQIPAIIENIKRHMDPYEGTLIGTLNMSPGEHHRCIKTREEWDRLFEEHGFTSRRYPFQTTSRTSLEGLASIFQLQADMQQKGITRGHPEYRQIRDQEAAMIPENPHHYPFCYQLKRSPK